MKYNFWKWSHKIISSTKCKMLKVKVKDKFGKNRPELFCMLCVCIVISIISIRMVLIKCVWHQIICNNTQYSNIQTFLPHVYIQSVIVMSYNHFTHIECPFKVFVHGIVNQHYLLDLDQGDLKVINSLDQKSCKQINQNLKQFLF